MPPGCGCGLPGVRDGAAAGRSAGKRERRFWRSSVSLTAQGRSSALHRCEAGFSLLAL